MFELWKNKKSRGGEQHRQKLTPIINVKVIKETGDIEIPKSWDYKYSRKVFSFNWTLRGTILIHMYNEGTGGSHVHN